ncbi:hypothetical protein [Pseudalkalibacillus sp. SCS-8]|uniref:hypothetical protein n=1 Tax=Pseudalkalibacillus nanhaiensis TaxID=3115291 RepID=UPI0032DA5B2E
MYKRLLALSIGYWSLYLVVNEIPTESYPDFRRWLMSLIFQPFTFIWVSVLALIGIIAYGVIVQWMADDLRQMTKTTWFMRVLFCILFILSVYFLYLMNAMVMLVILPCIAIYGIMSMTQSKNVVRRQDGAE